MDRTMWRTWLAWLSIGSAGMVERPLCEMHSPNTPVAGFLSQGNLMLDAGCRYRLFEKSNAASCLKGNWIAVTGSSNALLQFNNLVNFLAPGEYFVDRTGELIGVSAVVDVVIVDGKVTHWDTVSNHAHPCRQVDLKEEAKRWPDCRQLIQDMFSKVPAHDLQSVRLTFFTSFFWKRTELALQLIEEDTVWKMANFGLVTQIGAWYKNCCFMKFQYCPRKELLAYDIFAEGGELFKAELEESLGRLQSFCGPRGRAQLGCNVQTISYTNGPRDKKVFKHLNQFILQAMEKLKTPQFRLVDFFALGQGMPEEVYGDHASQMLNIWGWIVQLNTFCPEQTASSASYATWDGTMCTGMEARYQKCPKYFQKCSIGQKCEKWECMNSVPCTFRAQNEAPLFFGNSPGLCDKPVNASSFLAQRSASGDRCHRIWCSDQLHWLLAVFTVLLAMGLKYWLSRQEEKVEPSKKVEVADLKDQESPRVLELSGQGDGERDPTVTAPLLESTPSLEVVLSDGSPEPGSPSKSKNQSGIAFSFFGRKRTGDASGTAATAVAPAVPETESKVTVTSGDGAIRRSSKTKLVSSASASEAMNSSSQDENIQNSMNNTPTKITKGVEIRVTSDSAESNLNSESKEIDLPLPAAGDKYPLGLARFLASSHVVVGHLFARGVTAPIYFFHWGFTWVPWFFMLSGFVLFSAFLKGPKEETMVQYVLRRSTTIYPLYAFALLLAFIIGKLRGNIYTEWPTLLAQSFLVQSWLPFFTENALQMHCWFLSCLVVYWFFFKPISLRLRDITLKQTCQLMGFFFALPWLLILIPAILHDQEDWYKEHDFYETDTFLDFGVVMIKYHPFCYFHVFLLGMLLAKLRQLLDQHARACKEGCFSWRNPYVVALQFVAPCGYLALLLIFTIQTFHAKAWGYKLAARVSVLLPFQAMILFGLAGLPSLPLPFFSYGFSKLDFLEKYSYTVYIFQFLLYGFWPQVGQVTLPVFLIFLYSSSYIIANCIQQPIQKWWASHQTGQMVVPVALAAFFMVCCAIPDLQMQTASAAADLPALVQLDRSIDVRLKLHDPEGHPGSSIINPSVLVKDDEIIVVARRHRRETKQHSGVYDGPDGSWDAVIIEEIWHSDIVMGRAAMGTAGSAWNSWMEGVKLVNPVPEVTVSTWGGLLTEDGEAWEDLCVVETWIPENRTLMRMIVTGPEDPKVVDWTDAKDAKDGQDGILLAFDSRPPKGPSSCRRNTQGRLESVPQMYVASSIDVSKPLAPVKGYRLKSGSSDLAEKNWIPFVYDSSLHFVYTPLPHYILGADLDGSSSSDTIYSTTHGPFHQLQKEHLEIRGSAQAVLVNNPKSTPHLPRPHYLALIHLFDPSTHRYGHFAYRFQAEPPFTILQVSSQLPLSEAAATPNGVAFAFASGLAVKGNTVLVTYGAGDREARALVMTMEKLDELFQCGSAQAPMLDSK